MFNLDPALQGLGKPRSLSSSLTEGEREEERERKEKSMNQLEILYDVETESYGFFDEETEAKLGFTTSEPIWNEIETFSIILDDDGIGYQFPVED